MDRGDDSDKRDIARALSAAKRQRDFDDLQAEISGINIGRQARFLNAGQSSQQAKAKKRRAQERSDAELFYLALMNSGQLGGYIADEIFDGKSDWEIFAIITRIETETGMRFEDYAATILGVEAVQRMDGESDAAHKRRLLKSLAEEMLEADGGIKAQFADDPLADIIRGDTAYQKIMSDISQINRDGPGYEAGALVAAYKKAGYETAELSAEHIESEGYKGDLREGQDGHVDITTNSKELVGESNAFFGAIGAIAQAAEIGKSQFNASAAKPERSAQTKTATLVPTKPKT